MRLGEGEDFKLIVKNYLQEKRKPKIGDVMQSFFLLKLRTGKNRIQVFGKKKTPPTTTVIRTTTNQTLNAMTHLI